jgi:hypothetical protein
MSMIKDADGKVSFSRISGAVIIVANLITGAIMAQTGTLTALPDIPINWGMLVAALMGINAFKTNK